LPPLRLVDAEIVLESSINSVHLLRFIKVTKEQNISELMNQEFQNDMIKIFGQKESNEESEKSEKIKIPENLITLKELRSIVAENIQVDIEEEVIETVFSIFQLTFNEETKIDFITFCKIFYIFYKKDEIERGTGVEEEKENGNSEMNKYEEEDEEAIVENNSHLSFEEYANEI
jgi:hypothetical protein